MKVPIVAGTDAGFVGVIPGFDLHNELRLLVEEAGASNLQALQSATILPAKMHKLKKFGNVAEGFYADFLVLNSNPLKNINATKDIHMIVSNGETLNSKQIKQLKDECKNLN